MTEEVQAVAENPAPEQDATAAPETVVSTPEVAEETATEDKPAEKTYTQAEIDAMIGKRPQEGLARDRRAALFFDALLLRRHNYCPLLVRWRGS